MASRITIGNTRIAGFVNSESAGRFLMGTGSYTAASGKVFKESVSVFLDPKYDGTVPTKGEYVEVRGDLSIAPRRDHPEDLGATMNIRFADQLQVLEAPRARSEAPANAGDI